MLFRSSEALPSTRHYNTRWNPGCAELIHPRSPCTCLPVGEELPAPAAPSLGPPAFRAIMLVVQHGHLRARKTAVRDDQVLQVRLPLARGAVPRARRRARDHPGRWAVGFEVGPHRVARGLEGTGGVDFSARGHCSAAVGFFRPGADGVKSGGAAEVGRPQLRLPHLERDMSAFAAAGYAADAYRAFRPSYGPALLDLVSAYHASRGGAFGVAVDVGCGTGQATIPLTRRFSHVLGTDPSPNMVASATAALSPPPAGLGPGKVSFVAGSDTDWAAVKAYLAELGPDAKIDLVAGAQTAHWWDIPAFLAAVRPLCRSRGTTLALLGYTLVQHRTRPRITELLRDTAYGEDKLGPFWEPGRMILEDGYAEVEAKLKEGGVRGLARVEFLGREVVPATDASGFGAHPSAFVELDMSLAAFRNYLGTWSSYNTWKKQHPGKAGTPEDHVERLVLAVWEELGGAGKKDEEVLVELDWPHFLICGEL